MLHIQKEDLGVFRKGYNPRIIVLKFQTDRPTRTKVIAVKPWCLQTDRQQTHNIRLQNFCGRIKKKQRMFQIHEQIKSNKVDIS